MTQCLRITLLTHWALVNKSSVTLMDSSNTVPDKIGGMYVVALGIGGAILTTNGSELNISQSRFNNNYADYTGGSVYSALSSLLISDSFFENNTAGLSGGAISSFYNCSVTIEMRSFINNSAQGRAIGIWGIYDTNSEGGAILISRSKLKMCQSQCINNYASLQGGSVRAYVSSLLIHSSLFENNTAGY